MNVVAVGHEQLSAVGGEMGTVVWHGQHGVVVVLIMEGGLQPGREIAGLTVFPAPRQPLPLPQIEPCHMVAVGRDDGVFELRVGYRRATAVTGVDQRKLHTALEVPLFGQFARRVVGRQRVGSVATVGQPHTVVHRTAQLNQPSTHDGAENRLLPVVGHACLEHGRQLVGVVTPDVWLGRFKVILRRIVGIHVRLYARKGLSAVP